MGGGSKSKKKKKGGRAKGKASNLSKGGLNGVFDFSDMNGMLEDTIAETLFGDLGTGNMSQA